MPDTPSQKPAGSSADAEKLIPPLCSVFRRFLKKRGLKFTTERAKILDAVLEKEGLFEADQLMFEMQTAGQRVSKATIYRTLKHLVEANIIREVLLDSKQAHYQVSYGRAQTDHLVDMNTEEIVEFHSPELIELRDRICREHGIEPIGHRFLIFGVKPGHVDEPDADDESGD